MSAQQEPVAWAVVDDRFNMGAFAVYLSQNDAETRQQSAERDGPCHVVKLVPALTLLEREVLREARNDLVTDGFDALAAVIDGLLERTKTHTQEEQHASSDQS